VVAGAILRTDASRAVAAAVRTERIVHDASIIDRGARLRRPWDIETVNGFTVAERHRPFVFAVWLIPRTLRTLLGLVRAVDLATF
jgi:hypothetical protein